MSKQQPPRRKRTSDGARRRRAEAARERGTAGVAQIDTPGASQTGRSVVARILGSRSAIVAASTMLVVLALTLGATLSVATADSSFRDDLLAPYLLPVRHLYDGLQRAARHGVAVDRSAGVRRDIDRTRDTLAQLARRAGAAVEPAIALVNPRGELVYGAGPPVKVVTSAFVEALSLPNHDGGPASGKHFVEDGDRTLIAFRIVDGERSWAATVIASLDNTRLKAGRDALRATALRNCVFSLAIAMLFYVLLLTLIFDVGDRNSQRTLKRILWVSAAFALVAQVAAIDVSLRPYRDAYPGTVSAKTRSLSEIALADLEPALRRGVSLEFMDFRPFDWDGLLKMLPETERLSVRDAAGEEVVRITREEVVHLLNEKLAPRIQPVFPAGDAAARLSSWDLPRGAGGSIELSVSSEGLTERMLDVGADAFTATMVSLLVFMEALLLYHLVLGARGAPAAAASGRHAAGLMRPAAFMFVFGIDLCMSFVPLHTERLYVGGDWLSPEVMMGLPISAEFLFVGLAILVAGTWIDRRGWRPPFVAGVVLASAGSFYSWAAPDVLHFVLSRGVVGAGFGLVLMSAQSFVVRRSSGGSTAGSLAQLFAGIYGGTICGGVAGAVLAERIGFEPVFFLGGLMTASVLAYVGVALSRDEPVQAPAPPPPAGGALLRERLGGFVGNRGVLALVLLSSLPASIAAVGFLNYFSPVYLHRLGASQSTIGQILMLYGVCLVFVGPLVSRAVVTVAARKHAVVAGTLLGGAAFLAFNVFDGTAAVVAVVLLLGVAHSLVLSSQSAYLLALHAARELGQGLAMSLFRSSSRLGQMLGPAVFAVVVLAVSPAEGMASMGYAFVACAALFWLLTRRDESLLVEEG